MTYSSSALNRVNSRAKAASIAARVVRSAGEVDKVAVLALLSAVAVFAPFAVAVLKQAARIFA